MKLITPKIITVKKCISFLPKTSKKKSTIGSYRFTQRSAFKLNPSALHIKRVAVPSGLYPQSNRHSFGLIPHLSNIS